MLKRLFVPFMFAVWLTACGANQTNDSLAETEQGQEVEMAKKEAPADNPNPKVEEVSAALDLITKDYVHHNITIHYPQLQNFIDQNKQQVINEMIRTEAIKGLNYYSGLEDELTLEVDYKVSRKTSKVLSIQYAGTGYVEGAAHPNELFYTTNIDIDREKPVRLHDMIHIDDAFVDKMMNGPFKPLNPEMGELVNYYSREEWINQLQNADSLDHIGTELHSDTFSYLTEDSLGISIGIPHGAGGHLIFEIKYEDLTEHINHDHPFWGDILKDPSDT